MTPPDPFNGETYDPRALLGEFQTDSWLPVYRPGTAGAWTIRRLLMAACRGYWGQVYGIHGTVVLSGPGREGRAPWMSMTPSEIESQDIGLRAAHGHTVVLGFGLGWLAANAALRNEVDHVTVVERDPEIIAMIEATGVLEQLPEAARRKLEVVQGDALTWRPSAPVDTLQADIWERFIEDGKLGDVRIMQENIGAKAVYFWGQEMEMWRFACRREEPNQKLTWPMIRSIAETEMGLPLILPDWPDYPEKIAAGAPWWTPGEPDWWR
jgi:hypothetical protein